MGFPKPKPINSIKQIICNLEAQKDNILPLFVKKIMGQNSKLGNP